MEFLTINSNYDNLPLSVAMIRPTITPKAVIAFSHGMCEHKERYYPFLEYLSANGYVCIIHDHRGHGHSVKKPEDLGYFYTEDISAIVDDLHQVAEYAHDQYKDLPLYIFSHSMGTLVSRNFLKKYDNTIDKLVLCGPPTYNKVAAPGILIAKCSRQRRKVGPAYNLHKIAFGEDKDPIPNQGLSTNPDNIAAYNSDPLCGFVFSANGFINLTTLQKEAYNARNWHPQNKDLPIFIIAGELDGFVGSDKLFNHLISFLHKVGYTTISSKRYPGLRHEILNEKEKDVIYADVLKFFE